MKIKSSKVSILSVVWFIPIVAMLTGCWLLYKNYLNMGTEITLYIANAEGIEANNTTLKVLNVEVGKIKTISLRKNDQGVELKALIHTDSVALLAEDSQFWIVKPRFDKAGISGLSTLVSGSYIEILPGKSTKKKYIFDVLDRPSSLSYQSKGTLVQLVGKDHDTMLAAGSAVLYKNIPAGRVEYVYFDPLEKTTHYQIFVADPYDELLGDKVNFWISLGVTLETIGGQIKLEGLSFNRIVGSISFSEPNGYDKGQTIENNHTFNLFADENSITEVISPHAVYLVAFFDQDIKNLAKGALVQYKGVNVGKVVAVPYFINNDNKKLFTNKYIPALFYLDPELINENNSTEFQQNIKNAISKGLVATAMTDNLLTGNQYVYLYEKDQIESVTYPQAQYNHYMVIPTTLTGLSGIVYNINSLVYKLQNLPLDKTMESLNLNLRELKQTISSIKQITNKINSDDVISNLNSTINQLNNSLEGISPNSRLYRDLNLLIKNLNQFSNKLNEKPSSLFFDFNKQDPIPRGH